MKNNTNVIKNLFDRARAWFRVRFVRKVFGVAAVLSLVFLCIGRFDKSGICSITGVVCAIIAILASTYDTELTRKQFVNMVKEMKQKHYVRMVEGIALQEKCFTDTDEALIKRKERSFKTSILLKLVLITFLVILLINVYF